MALLYDTYNLGLGDFVQPKDFSDEKWLSKYNWIGNKSAKPQNDI